MIDSQTEQEIITLSSKGLGRTRVARRLGCTEWAVRSTLRKHLTKSLKKKEVTQKLDFDIRLSAVTKSAAKTRKAVVLSDVHIPYHDPRALAVAVEFMKDYEPDDIVLNGDIVDFYGVSAYRKDPNRIDTIQDEIDETNQFLQLLRKNHPLAKMSFTMGNHEDRMQRFIMDKASALSSLQCLALDDLLGLKELGIEFVDTKSRVLLGDLEVTHGTVVRKHSGASAKAHHDSSGGSVLIGHVHRLGTFYHSNRWGTHVAIENGYLARNDFDYTDRPNWQQGFTCVEYQKDGQFTVRQHMIQEGVMFVDGTKYEA